MAKARVTIEVPDSVLVAEKEKELKKLRTENVKLLNKVRDLEIKINSYERETQEIEKYRRVYDNLREHVKDNFDLYSERYYDDRY